MSAHSPLPESEESVPEHPSKSPRPAQSDDCDGGLPLLQNWPGRCSAVLAKTPIICLLFQNFRPLPKTTPVPSSPDQSGIQTDQSGCNFYNYKLPYGHDRFCSGNPGSICCRLPGRKFEPHPEKPDWRQVESTGNQGDDVIWRHLETSDCRLIPGFPPLPLGRRSTLTVV